MRLFAAVWPSEEATAVLAALPRPALPGIRWTTPDQWHVTLAFLGDVNDADAAGYALERAAQSVAAVTARLGPGTARLGRTVLCVPVEGLDGWARAVRLALAAAGVVLPAAGRPGAGPTGEDHPFRGHCTLARARRGRTVPESLAGAPVEACWTARTLCLVRSTLDPGGTRYETVRSATVPS